MLTAFTFPELDAIARLSPADRDSTYPSLRGWSLVVGSLAISSEAAHFVQLSLHACVPCVAACTPFCCPNFETTALRPSMRCALVAARAVRDAEAQLREDGAVLAAAASPPAPLPFAPLAVAAVSVSLASNAGAPADSQLDDTLQLDDEYDIEVLAAGVILDAAPLPSLSSAAAAAASPSPTSPDSADWLAAPTVQHALHRVLGYAMRVASAHAHRCLGSSDQAAVPLERAALASSMLAVLDALSSPTETTAPATAASATHVLLPVLPPARCIPRAHLPLLRRPPPRRQRIHRLRQLLRRRALAQ